MNWNTLKVSPDGTHHIDGCGVPAYQDRFDEVLKFHDPGLAPVLRNGLAWHITTEGLAAYPRRFLRVFGFYGGVAAVVADDGWHHIRADGRDAYPQRYAWCGNMQEGRVAVRDLSGSYFHIDGTGMPAYGSRWRYAGDYRDGIAVIQASDGRSTHIDQAGALTHACWFLDLDVFHKGFAKAKDEAGWMHIDRHGRPCYERRFAAVEPFYNGQSRVERFDGGLEVVDERGATVIELRPARRSEFAALSSDMVGFWRTDAIAAAVELGVIDALPGTTNDVAARLGLNAGRLCALLRGLCELSLVKRVGEAWLLTDRGQYLRHDHEMTLADAAGEYAGPLRSLWASIPEALQDNTWEASDVFGDVASNPSRVVAHHRMLRSYARHDYALLPESLGLRGDERVLDIGGGVGVLAGFLLDYHPGLDVVVIDRPEVVAQVPVRDGLQAVAADLFGQWFLEAEVAILARVVHDWPDEQAIQILLNAHRSLPRSGRMFLVEMIVADDGSFGGLCDLHLLLATGGRERTRKEYEALLDAAGFDLVEVRSSGALPSVLVGVAR